MKPIVCGTFLAFNLMLAAPAFAAPVLKTQVDVSGQVVTVGEMFEDAGASAARPCRRRVSRAMAMLAASSRSASARASRERLVVRCAACKSCSTCKHVVRGMRFQPAAQDVCSRAAFAA